MEMNTLCLVCHGDEWVSKFPCSAKGGSCSLTGSCGCPGQWQRQIQSIDISYDDWCDSTSNLHVMVLTGSEGYLAIEVIMAKYMAWWRQWQNDSYYCVWLLMMWKVSHQLLCVSVWGLFEVSRHVKTWQIQLGVGSILIFFFDGFSFWFLIFDSFLMTWHYSFRHAFISLKTWGDWMNTPVPSTMGPERQARTLLMLVVRSRC